MRIDQDIKPTEIVDETMRLFSLDQPSLKALSYILRHKELWPDTFVWDYKNCHTCAMGLAAKLWGLFDPYDTPVVPKMIKAFDLPKKFAVDVFGGSSIDDTYGVDWYMQVKPEMVADQIDLYLASEVK